MSSFRHQSLIPASTQAVWDLVGDPNSYPEWAGDTIEVTGLPEEIEKGTKFERVSTGPFGKQKTNFVIDELSDLREIKLRCLKSGYYSHWSLTEAGGDTFCEVEIGMEPERLPYRVIDRTVGKRWYRKATTEMFDGLRKKLT